MQAKEEQTAVEEAPTHNHFAKSRELQRQGRGRAFTVPCTSPTSLLHQKVGVHNVCIRRSRKASFPGDGLQELGDVGQELTQGFRQQAAQLPDSPGRFVAFIEHAQDLNHLSIFMDGSAPFPEGYACTIHLEVPGKGWSLIGGLSNTKPSAIFRLRGTFIPSAQSQSSGFASSSSSTTNDSQATLGILCEPIPAVEAQLLALGAGGRSAEVTQAGAMVLAAKKEAPTEPVLVAQKVGLNLMNHISGFAQPLPDGSGSWVDMRVVERWYQNFERKLNLGGVGFLLQSD